MTFIPEKKDAIYVRGVVIACGMRDDQGDIAPNKEGIKKIFTNYLKQESDVQHSYISNFNVHQLENTITSTETTINGQYVPEGSWIASHMVLNPSIIAMIRSGNLKGYSLGAIGDAGLNENISFQNMLNKSSLMYKDLSDYEELNPFFISFVDSPSNGFTWEVMDYDHFLSKSSNNFTGEIMSEEIKETKEEMVKLSVVERLLGPLLNKASGFEEEEYSSETEEDVEEETVISNDEIMARLNDLPNRVATVVIESMKELANQTVAQETEESNLAKSTEEKSEEDLEEEKENKLEKSSDKETKTETESEENVKLDKSSSKLDEMTKPKVTPKEKFLGGTKRDEYGRVRKYL